MKTTNEGQVIEALRRFRRAERELIAARNEYQQLLKRDRPKREDDSSEDSDNGPRSDPPRPQPPIHRSPEINYPLGVR